MGSCLLIMEEDGQHLGQGSTRCTREKLIMIVCLGLESTVKQSIYLPNTPWVIQYNSPPVCSRGTKLIDLNIEGIDEEHVTFPFTVY